MDQGLTQKEYDYLCGSVKVFYSGSHGLAYGIPISFQEEFKRQMFEDMIVNERLTLIHFHQQYKKMINNKFDSVERFQELCWEAESILSSLQ